MTGFQLVVGIWLFFAPWTRAQRVVAPVEGLPSRTVISAPVPVPILPASPLTSPSALLSPGLLPAASVSQAPVAVKLATVRAAVAQFAAIDLKSAPAAESREGAEALMARALGAEIAETPAAAPGSPSAVEMRLSPSSPEAALAPAFGSRIHLLAKPLKETVELGPAARALHYAVEIGLQFVNAAIAWHATGSPAAGLTVLAIGVIKTPPMITAQSLGHLNILYQWRKLATLRRFADDMPAVTRIRVLTTGHTKFSGILARRQENTGIVFVDASGPLPSVIPNFGAPIPVANLGVRRARLVLVRDDVAEPIQWAPTLADLLSGAPIPADIAAAWRARLDADKKDKSSLKRLFDFKKGKELRIEAHMSDGAGGETPMGAVVFGGSVKHLVGLGRLDRIRAIFGRAPAARGIPLSDTTVERGGVRTGGGVVSRAWRRLTGGLIVRP